MWTKHSGLKRRGTCGVTNMVLRVNEAPSNLDISDSRVTAASEQT